MNISILLTIGSMVRYNLHLYWFFVRLYNKFESPSWDKQQSKEEEKKNPKKFALRFQKFLCFRKGHNFRPSKLLHKWSLCGDFDKKKSVR